MEAKQHASEKPTDHRRNQKGNQNMHRNNWKWKHNNPNLWDSANAVLRGGFIAIQAYFKKQEKHQINNLTLHLKQLKKDRKTPQLVEGKKS